MTGLKPFRREIERHSSSFYVAQHLRRLIFEGVLRPGQRVPQDDVARDLGLSRIPVREAIIALEAEGFITTVRHRGAFVSAIDERALRDQYELHGIIHGFAATRALDRSAPSFVHPLRQIAEELAATDDLPRIGELAFSFHRAVVAGARSSGIKVVFRSMPGLHPADFFTVVPAAVAIERCGISAILRAIEAGDRKAVADAYLVLMRGIGGEVVALFESRGLFKAPDERDQPA